MIFTWEQYQAGFGLVISENILMSVKLFSPDPPTNMALHGSPEPRIIAVFFSEYSWWKIYHLVTTTRMNMVDCLVIKKEERRLYSTHNFKKYISSCFVWKYHFSRRFGLHWSFSNFLTSCWKHKSLNFQKSGQIWIKF